MRIRILLIVLVAFISSVAKSQSDGPLTYIYSVDLTQVKDDKVKVELAVPDLGRDQVVYHIPRIVPGTYAIYDFGRFVSDFHAYDKKGKEMKVTPLNADSWQIDNAKQLDKLSYWVQDTWDTDIDSNFVFEPGGSNIEADSNFMINNFCFFGYIDNMKQLSYSLLFSKPKGFYGASSMQQRHIDETHDLFSADNYYSVADAPIMFDRPDTTVIDVAGTKVMVSAYSPHNIITSKFVADNIKEILFAAKDYLGGKLPVSNYTFLMYFDDKNGKSGGYGALEHSYSSMYYLFETAPENIQQTLRDVTAHEFLHIVTPLSIHSEEIGNYDYDVPRMSEHLWMYEGVTEYSAHLMQIKDKLITLDDFLKVLSDKMKTSMTQYNDTLPFTVMSKDVLVKYKSQYDNVYEKGALIGMCLDLKLRTLSEGKYGVQDLLKDLSKVYGKDHSFKDDELFDEIQKLTYPEIGDFLRTYVSGPKPLPFKDILAAAGIIYYDKKTESAFTLGNVSLSFNPQTNRLIVANTDNLNSFGKKMGYQTGDELVSFNGVELRPQNVQKTFDDFFKTVKEGDKLKIVVVRKVKGKDKKKTLHAKMMKIDKVFYDELEADPNATAEQMKIRKAWLGDYKTE